MPTVKRSEVVHRRSKPDSTQRLVVAKRTKLMMKCYGGFGRRINFADVVEGGYPVDNTDENINSRDDAQFGYSDGSAVKVCVYRISDPTLSKRRMRAT